LSNFLDSDSSTINSQTDLSNLQNASTPVTSASSSIASPQTFSTSASSPSIRPPTSSTSAIPTPIVASKSSTPASPAYLPDSDVESSSDGQETASDMSIQSCTSDIDNTQHGRLEMLVSTCRLHSSAIEQQAIQIEKLRGVVQHCFNRMLEIEERPIPLRPPRAKNPNRELCGMTTTRGHPCKKYADTCPSRLRFKHPEQRNNRPTNPCMDHNE
jgi:hypothetical protein